MARSKVPPGVLTDHHLGLINQCLGRCASTQELIDKAKKAGIPVDALEAQNKLHYETAVGIKREFFPGQP